MKKQQFSWENWAQFLQQYKLMGFISFLVEIGSPFRVILAQFLYLMDPFFAGKKLHALAETMEKPAGSKDFQKQVQDLKR